MNTAGWLLMKSVPPLLMDMVKLEMDAKEFEAANAGEAADIENAAEMASRLKRENDIGLPV
jgi:hypothetical protein